MYRAKFAIRHGGCWTVGLSRIAPELKIFILNSVVMKDGSTSDILCMSGGNFEAVAQYLRTFPTISTVDEMYTDEDRLLLHIVTKGGNVLNSAVFSSGCFILGPVVISKGEETWTVGAANKRSIDSLFKSLKRYGDVRLLSLGATDFMGASLLKRQKDALQLAHSMRYYSWPRGTTIGKLAKRAGLSKSAFVEHLRRAEAKVIGAYLED